jgi:hypothetical protein
MVRLAADEACRTVIAAQRGLPSFKPGILQTLVWARSSDEQVQERLKQRCIARHYASLCLYKPSS